MVKKLALLSALLVISLLLLVGCGEEEEELLPAKILVVHSYHPEYAWVADINKGLEDELEKLAAGGKLSREYELEYHYMDTKRIPADEFAQAGTAALAKIDEYMPDIVVTADDNAQEYVTKALLDREGISVVFLGVNNEADEKYGIVNNYDVPGHNVTGCLERERFVGTFDILKDIYPDVTTVAFVYDDGTTAPPIIERCKAEAARLGLEVVMDKSVGSPSEWQAAILEANEAADFIYLSQYHSLEDETGASVDSDAVMSWTFENATIPLTSVWNWSVEGGALCAEAISGINQGEVAANLIMKIINGVDVAKIPVEINVDGERMLNTSTATKLGVEIAPFLKDSCTIVQ